MQTLLRPDGSKVPHLQVTVKLGQCLWRLPMLPPLMKRRCGEAECPQAAWEASDEWTECRPSCGAGERTRQVTCMAPTGDGNASEPVADSRCSAAGTKPKAVLPCSGIPCTPVWAQMPYTKCDPLSWPSTRQRDVLCLRRTSLTMYERLADEECAIVKPKPRTSRGCPRPRTSGK
ncbi:A disintegrin and metalloproteinase with thrombospondin motifs 20-like [Sycon ciliatum]|uniref:A disintegrin and metalloproteinase with thrombospondin motifs 20-like n=1 Tax=Sycon ciliatum TaxID=27933 RepID=UPI0031F704F8